MIRASYQQEMYNINVDEVPNLTMLVEIGLDKLRRDYTNFFIGTLLCLVVGKPGKQKGIIFSAI